MVIVPASGASGRGFTPRTLHFNNFLLSDLEKKNKGVGRPFKPCERVLTEMYEEDWGKCVH